MHDQQCCNGRFYRQGVETPEEWPAHVANEFNMTEAPDLRVIATGLRFPEGPVAMDDGAVLVVEIARGTLSRVTPDGPR